MAHLDGTFTLGLDLGGTNARAAAVDGDGSLLSLEKRRLRERTPEAVADVLAEVATAALRASERPPEQCIGVGVGIAGQIEARTHRVIVAPNLGWRDVDIAGLLAARLGRPVLVANDLSVAALGEVRAGAARGYTDAILVFVGSGVGSGLVLGGRLHEGARGVAGEFGHIKVKPDGRLCGCGERGCLEAYVGGHNLAARAAEAIAAGRASSLQPRLAPVLMAEDVERGAGDGDALALELRAEAAELLSVATANLVTCLNPGVLVLGGGVLLGSPWMRQKVEEGVRAMASRASAAELAIVDPSLADDAGVLGAAFLPRG